MSDDYQVRRDIDRLKRELIDMSTDQLKVVQYNSDNGEDTINLRGVGSTEENTGTLYGILSKYRVFELPDLIKNGISGDGGSIDLSGYVTDEELNGILSSYVVSSTLSDYARKSELFSGSYNDLSNKPVIPSKTSQLTNDSGFLTSHQSLSDYLTESEINQLLSSYALSSALNNYYTESETDNLLEDKVDKVDGKGLSTEDYTTSEKNKLNGIEAGANKTVVDNSLSPTSTNPVQNKAIYSAIAETAGMNLKEVSSLPATGEEGVLYLLNPDVPVENGIGLYVWKWTYD